MNTWRVTPGVLSLLGAFWVFTASVQAQTFEDRWSIVPKAKADEAPAQPNPAQSQPTPPLQAETAAPSAATAATPLPRAKAKPTEASQARPSPNRVFLGKASFISYAGGKTASGAQYRPQAFTAAHRKLPFGTRIKVTDVRTRKSVHVVVTDRGPAIRSRVLDLSRGAAEALGMTERGIVEVRAQVLGKGPAPIAASGHGEVH